MNNLNDAIRILKENNFVLGINICDGLKEGTLAGCENCCLYEYADDFCAMFSVDRDGKALYEILVKRVRKQKLEKLLSR